MSTHLSGLVLKEIQSQWLISFVYILFQNGVFQNDIGQSMKYTKTLLLKKKTTSEYDQAMQQQQTIDKSKCIARKRDKEHKQ